MIRRSASLNSIEQRTEYDPAPLPGPDNSVTIALRDGTRRAAPYVLAESPYLSALMHPQWSQAQRHHGVYFADMPTGTFDRLYNFLKTRDLPPGLSQSELEDLACMAEEYETPILLSRLEQYPLVEALRRAGDDAKARAEAHYGYCQLDAASVYFAVAPPRSATVKPPSSPTQQTVLRSRCPPKPGRLGCATRAWQLRWNCSGSA